MSGGEYDYFFGKIEDLSEEIRNKDTDIRRSAFCRLLKLISEALYAIEWVDSGDWSDGEEYEAIDNVFKFLEKEPGDLMKSIIFDQIKELLMTYEEEKLVTTKKY